MREQGERCSLCGTATWEWEEDPHAYHPEEEFCPGCYMKQMAQDTEGTANSAGVSISLFPRGLFPKKIDLIGARKRDRKARREKRS